ncbi:MAG: DUF58 domain-containing protein, partial [Ferruginibacter sp.]
TRFYLLGGVCALILVISFFVPVLFLPARVFLLLFIFITLVDYFLLFFVSINLKAFRTVASRLSNGEENLVEIYIRNSNRFKLRLTIIDELPMQLQERNFSMKRTLSGGEHAVLKYSIHPVERGAYNFGNIILLISSVASVVVKKQSVEAAKAVSVYPSFMSLRNHQIVSQTATNNETGNQRKRKIGQSMEFEQIKDYVTGDDIRTINWKATARKGLLMVNNYVDEKSQQVFCLVDKGRLMKMPFKEMSLLDYAINAVLALSNVCLQKQDKIGLITFSNKLATLIPADRKLVQRENILQALYKEQTAFLESDYEMLYMQIRNKIKQRSLLILFTNFESVSGLRRQLPYLRSIAKHHLLLVVFFENSELNILSREDAITVDDIYVKTIAEKFVFEKKLVVKELQKFGILSMLTAPENLTVNSINKYLEVKARQAV